MSTYQLGGREYPVTGYIDTELGSVPLVALPMGSDYEWQLLALESRIKRPELYGSDLEAEIDQLLNWLKANRPS